MWRQRVNTKWWDLAFPAASVMLAAVAVIAWTPHPDGRLGVWVTLAVINACYFTFGRLAPERVQAAIPFFIVLIIGSGVLAAFQPTMATFQAVAIPAVWNFTRSVRSAIVVTVCLVICVAIGLTISLGATADALGQATLVETLSLAFSIALGLWISRVAQYGAERARLLDELTAAQDQLAAANREAGVASERERISREIHDTITQSLTSLVMLAQRTRAELEQGGADGACTGTSTATESVELIETTARDALTDARSLVSALAPLPGGDRSFAEVIGRLAARFERETGMRVDVAVDASGLPREVEVVLLRCTQESLANVRKHAEASAAQVTVSRTADSVRLSVHDDGRGIGEYSLEADDGFGLSGMRDRVGMVGGRLEFSGDSTAGTTIVVTIPRGQDSQ